jgi:hypothetical protein
MSLGDAFRVDPWEKGKHFGQIVNARKEKVDRGWKIFYTIKEIEGKDRETSKIYNSWNEGSKNVFSADGQRMGQAGKTPDEVIDFLNRTKPIIEFVIGDSGMIDAILRIVSSNEQQQEKEELDVQIPDYLFKNECCEEDGHFWLQIVGKKVLCRECTEDMELLDTWCLRPSLKYGSRFGLTWLEAQQKLDNRRKGKPWDEC